MVKQRVPYSKMDPEVVKLCRVLNRFPGVETYSSCGGHAEVVNSCQMERSTWYVDFHVDRGDEGHVSLEFLAWVNYGLLPGAVMLEPLAKPPFVNVPGKMLFYRWSGGAPDEPDGSADAFADLLADLRREYYVTAAQAAQWPPEALS